MIQQINFTSNNKEPKKRSTLSQVARGGVIGAVGGYTVFSLNGFENKTRKTQFEFIERSKKNKTILKSQLEEDAFKKIYKDANYKKKIDSLTSKGKKFKKDFNIKDILSETDYKNFKDKANFRLNKMNEILANNVKFLDKALNKKKWKHIEIGALVGLGIGIFSAIKSAVNSRKERVVYLK